MGQIAQHDGWRISCDPCRCEMPLQVPWQTVQRVTGEPGPSKIRGAGAPLSASQQRPTGTRWNERHPRSNPCLVAFSTDARVITTGSPLSTPRCSDVHRVARCRDHRTRIIATTIITATIIGSAKCCRRPRISGRGRRRGCAARRSKTLPKHLLNPSHDRCVQRTCHHATDRTFG